MTTAEIKLVNHNKAFSSRSRAHELFDAVSPDGSVVVDFKGVEEITPSFCHEMLRILLNEKKIRVKFLNADDSVKLQLNKALTVLKGA